MLLMPGQICAHTHFYGAFARGIYIPGPPAKDFPEILQSLWWKLDKALDLDGVRSSAEVCLADAIRTLIKERMPDARSADGRFAPIEAATPNAAPVFAS